MNLNLKDKKAIITGASRGVGRAIALALAAEGVHVVLGVLEMEMDLANSVAEEAKNLGVQAWALPLDLGSHDSTLAFMKAAHEALGEMDILINNAGIFLQGWCEDVSLSDWQKTLDINITGAFLTSQYFAKANLDAKKSGRIVNINSQAAFFGSTSGHVHYAASKAAMTGMTITMARELSSRDITVNAIALGIVNTDMIKANIEKDPHQYDHRIPRGRFAEPEDIAGIVTFMVSDPASYITGATIDATGGMLMR